MKLVRSEIDAIAWCKARHLTRITFFAGVIGVRLHRAPRGVYPFASGKTIAIAIRKLQRALAAKSSGK